ncbi:hypothetical protein T484DRAFT_1876041, partial [Baffinella frigidus]
MPRKGKEGGKGAGAAGGRAAQNPGATGDPELQALLVQFRLESFAAVFAELAVEKAADLEYLTDADIEALQIPNVAKRKMQAMLDWWREQNQSSEQNSAGGGGAAGGA